MEYATTYDVGDRKRDDGINEDSVAITVFEQGHRDGYHGQDRPAPVIDPGTVGTGPVRSPSKDGDAHDGEGISDDARDGDGIGDVAAVGGDELRRSSEAVNRGAEGEHDPRGPAAGTGTGCDDPAVAEAAGTAPSNRGVAVFALADGAGGYEAGDAASYLATTAVCEELASVAVRAARHDPAAFDLAVEEPLGTIPSAPDLESAVAAAIVSAHRDVVRYAAATGKQAHTTIVAGLAVGGRLHYGWVGDSRAYLVNERRSEIAQITTDHAVVEALSEAGEVDDVEARVHPRGNEITRALGGNGQADSETATVEVDTNTVELYAEDVVLLTSDGLIDAQTDAPTLYGRYVRADRDDAVGRHVRNRVVTDEEIRDRVLDAPSLDAAAADLVDLANERGGKDNVSTLLLRDRTLDPTPDPLPGRSADTHPPVEERHTVLGSEE